MFCDGHQIVMDLNLSTSNSFLDYMFLVLCCCCASHFSVFRRVLFLHLLFATYLISSSLIPFWGGACLASGCLALGTACFLLSTRQGSPMIPETIHDPVTLVLLPSTRTTDSDEHLVCHNQKVPDSHICLPLVNARQTYNSHTRPSSSSQSNPLLSLCASRLPTQYFPLLAAAVVYSQVISHIGLPADTALVFVSLHWHHSRSTTSTSSNVSFAPVAVPSVFSHSLSLVPSIWSRPICL
ncbi:hypothetical protein BS47DRAFT_1006158 [Hydnum rufescens UP504]|uniref:Uncharacterized protein n=1 Tax=Hydnum rufescens UP504 TaxID=1448309 RepID=A0A9P6DYW0_9AGAM|nr:hypothetical protein BS47DRAFT_1006158 [Hydnum rufescens UP504]